MRRRRRPPKRISLLSSSNRTCTDRVLITPRHVPSGRLELGRGKLATKASTSRRILRVMGEGEGVYEGSGERLGALRARTDKRKGGDPGHGSPQPYRCVALLVGINAGVHVTGCLLASSIPGIVPAFTSPRSGKHGGTVRSRHICVSPPGHHSAILGAFMTRICFIERHWMPCLRTRALGATEGDSRMSLKSKASRVNQF